MANETNIEVLTSIISALKDLEIDAQTRILQSVVTFLDIPLITFDRRITKNLDHNSEISKNEITFSENRVISPKEFLRDKAPKTDIERIACLAYYLAHYRDTPHFKTVDLSTLNTEAAQPKLSNPTVAVDSATRSGLLVQALKGSKQISAAGELFVQSLPDRDAARASIANMRTRKKVKKPISKAANINNENL